MSTSVRRSPPPPYLPRAVLPELWDLSEADRRKIYDAIAVLERLRYEDSRRYSFPTCEAVKDYFRLHLGAEAREHFHALFLNHNHHLLSHERLFSGDEKSCTVDVSVVARRTVAIKARYVIVGHNHPGGSTSPSDNDRNLTRQLKSAIWTVGSELRDHIIVARHYALSMAEQGTL